MDRNTSHGRHGGNRGAGDQPGEHQPNRRDNTDVASQANNRSENKGRRSGGG